MTKFFSQLFVESRDMDGRSLLISHRKKQRERFITEHDGNVKARNFHIIVRVDRFSKENWKCSGKRKILHPSGSNIFCVDTRPTLQSYLLLEVH